MPHVLSISTTYHLFIMEDEMELELEDVFVFSKKIDAQDLAEILQPKSYIIAGVMNIASESKLIWVAQHNLDSDVSQDAVLDLIHDSMTNFTEEFKDEWL